MRIGRLEIKREPAVDGFFLPMRAHWTFSIEGTTERRVPETGAALFDDISEEIPFWAARSGDNRIQRVTLMLNMGYISPHEARAMLGGP